MERGRVIPIVTTHTTYYNTLLFMSVIMSPMMCAIHHKVIIKGTRNLTLSWTPTSKSTVALNKWRNTINVRV